MKKLIPADSTNLLLNSTIVLDTNILINISRRSECHEELHKLFMQNNCNYMSIDLCILEFLRGSSNNLELNNNKELIKIFDIFKIPLSSLSKELEEVSVVYKQKDTNPSMVDLGLISLLWKYKKYPKIFLLTENYKDFFSPFLDKVLIWNYEENNKIIPIVLYKINSDEVEKRLKIFN